MTAGVFDALTNAFVHPITGGFGILSRYALPLLALLGLIYLLLRLSEVVVRGGALNDLLATVIWTVVKIGVFYWIIVVFRDLALAALNTFVTWGLAPSGGQFGLPNFLQPSRIVDAGFTAAVPLQDWIVNQTGMAALYNIGQILLYRAAYVAVIIGFVGMALAVMVALIEMHLAIMAGIVLFPWGILSYTMFLSELAISWIAAGLVRMFITAALMGISVPLFALAAMPPVSGDADPDLYGSLILAVVAILFAILVWIIPNRAAGMAGRGAALALTGEHIVSSGMAGFQGAQFAGRAGAEVIRGVSQMVKA
jgi:P-type conjugative transfer protein TrbL